MTEEQFPEFRREQGDPLPSRDPFDAAVRAAHDAVDDVLDPNAKGKL